TLALDGDVQDIKTAIETLAASAYLDEPVNLRAFYDEAATVAKSFGGWAVLSDPSGHQSMNTSRRFGEALPMPSPGSLAMMQQVAANRKTFVSNVFVGAVSRRPAVIIAVPVIREGRVRYVLDFPFAPTEFITLLQQAGLSEGWVAMITDRDGAIVARVPDADAFVGRDQPSQWAT